MAKGQASTLSDVQQKYRIIVSPEKGSRLKISVENAKRTQIVEFVVDILEFAHVLELATGVETKDVRNVDVSLV